MRDKNGWIGRRVSVGSALASAVFLGASVLGTAAPAQAVGDPELLALQTALAHTCAIVPSGIAVTATRAAFPSKGWLSSATVLEFVPGTWASTWTVDGALISALGVRGSYRFVSLDHRDPAVRHGLAMIGRRGARYAVWSGTGPSNLAGAAVTPWVPRIVPDPTVEVRREIATVPALLRSLGAWHSLASVGDVTTAVVPQGTRYTVPVVVSGSVVDSVTVDINPSAVLVSASVGATATHPASMLTVASTGSATAVRPLVTRASAVGLRVVGPAIAFSRLARWSLGTAVLYAHLATQYALDHGAPIVHGAVQVPVSALRATQDEVRALLRRLTASTGDAVTITHLVHGVRMTWRTTARSILFTPPTLSAVRCVVAHAGVVTTPPRC